MAAFNWTQLIPAVGHSYEHIATLGIASVGAIGLGFAAKSALGKGDVAVLPAPKFSLRGVFEMLTEMISGLTEMVIGHHGRAYVPIFASIFFFVLLNNLIGVLPGMTPATENINTTFGFGMFIFLFYNTMGIKEVGFLNYMKHFLGPFASMSPDGAVAKILNFVLGVVVLGSFMFLVEMISHMVRPMSLGLRLANVMMGDHVVLGVFLDLAPFFIPIPFYIIGLFVCFVQAFVFTLLSMVYVSLATAHEEH